MLLEKEAELKIAMTELGIA